MQGGYKEFHDLNIWKLGYTQLMNIYSLSETFPASETYALSSQIQRSANSIIANIAESHGRYSYKDKIRVLYIARGELLETRSHLSVALGRSYITKNQFEKINIAYVSLGKQLNGYIKSLQR